MYTNELACRRYCNQEKASKLVYISDMCLNVLRHNLIRADKHIPVMQKRPTHGKNNLIALT